MNVQQFLVDDKCLFLDGLDPYAVRVFNVLWHIASI